MNCNTPIDRQPQPILVESEAVGKPLVFQLIELSSRLGGYALLLLVLGLLMGLLLR